MRAAVLVTQEGRVEIRSDIAIDDPKAGQVRVRVTHCGLCHSDLSLIDAAFPCPLPIILGHEAAGVVESIGPGVERLAPGDPVVLTPCPPCGDCYWCVRGEAQNCVNALGIQTNSFADGTTGLSMDGKPVYRGVNVGAFAEYVLVQESGAIKISADVPLEVACVIGCAVQTGTGAVLNTASVEEGATVLIMGLGGIGLSAVQGARLAGASRIIVSDPVAERRDVAKRFGATDLLDPTKQDVAAKARELTEVGVDYAFETAGFASLVQVGLAATRNGGSVVCVGAPPLDESIQIAPAALLTISDKRILGCVLGGCNSLREIPRMLSLWRAGRLDLEGLITARRPIEDINLALDDLRASRGVRTVLSF